MRIQKLLNVQNASLNFNRTNQNNALYYNPNILSKDTVQFRGNGQKAKSIDKMAQDSIDCNTIQNEVPKVEQRLAREINQANDLMDDMYADAISQLTYFIDISMTRFCIDGTRIDSLKTEKDGKTKVAEYDFDGIKRKAYFEYDSEGVQQLKEVQYKKDGKEYSVTFPKDDLISIKQTQTLTFNKDVKMKRERVYSFDYTSSMPIYYMVKYSKPSNDKGDAQKYLKVMCFPASDNSWCSLETGVEYEETTMPDETYFFENAKFSRYQKTLRLEQDAAEDREIKVNAENVGGKIKYAGWN